MRHRVSTACTNAPLLPMSGRHFEIDLIWRHFWKIMAPFFFFFFSSFLSALLSSSSSDFSTLKWIQSFRNRINWQHKTNPLTAIEWRPLIVWPFSGCRSINEKQNELNNRYWKMLLKTGRLRWRLVGEGSRKRNENRYGLKAIKVMDEFAKGQCVAWRSLPKYQIWRL